MAADRSVPAEAFENYIQGLTADNSDKQIAHLKEAVRLDENFQPARLALGRAYFADQDYDQAATTLGQLPKDNANALEADFYRGLALFYTGNYRDAEDAFAFVTTRLPLPEVVNNQGVAATRRGENAGGAVPAGDCGGPPGSGLPLQSGGGAGASGRPGGGAEGNARRR